MFSLVVRKSRKRHENTGEYLGIDKIKVVFAVAAFLALVMP